MTVGRFDVDISVNNFINNYDNVHPSDSKRINPISLFLVLIL